MLLGHVRSLGLRLVWTVLVLGLCLTLAVVVEFCQLYFPPRTVSINDLIAESIGTVIGLLVATVWGQRLVKLANGLSLGGLLSVKTLIKFYLLGYIMLSIFPFDFVTSFAELDIKLESSQDHIFMSFDACKEDAVRCLVKIVVEILVLIPVGGLFYVLPHVAHKLALAVLIGFFLGFFIEIVQLFLYSGIGQGISILTRMLGMGLGVIIAKWLAQQKMLRWRKWLKPCVLMATLPYLVLVFVINGGLGGGWLPVELAMTKLADTHFLPFFYFYYTTETIALSSFISNAGIYMPIGFGWYLWYCADGDNKTIPWVWVGLCAVALAVIVETEKLFLADKHPDPTDIVIAFVAAAASYVLMAKALHWRHQEKSTATLKQRF
jgi:VanZ family protein